MAQVRRLSRAGGPLSVGGPTATMNVAAWFRGGEPTPLRRRLHRQLLAEASTGAGAGKERHAIVMAGPPGAGKSTVRVPFMAAEGLDPAAYTVIDADHFKEGLVDAALRDGSYERFIKPGEVGQLEAGGERFFPLEMSALLHEESGLLVRAQQRQLLRAGANVIIDTVLSNPDGAVLLGGRLEAAGYTVTVLDVEVSAELSQARIEHRWALAYRNALTGVGSAGGGRWVPSEYARMVFDGPQGPGGPWRSEVAAERLAQTCPVVLRYQVLRTAGGREQVLAGQPQLEVDLARSGPGWALVDAPGLARGVATPLRPGGGREPSAPGQDGRADPPRGPASMSLADRVTQQAQFRQTAPRSTSTPGWTPPAARSGPQPRTEAARSWPVSLRRRPSGAVLVHVMVDIAVLIVVDVDP